MKLPFSQITFQANKYHAIVDGMFVPFMLLGTAAGIKFSKKWYQQQRENEKLAKQKLATELQLLKTSIHPRFLFHSLQTVQHHINNSSAESPVLILQLSDLLSYILYEKDETWVPLEKEMEIIQHYIHLEKKGFKEPALFKAEFEGNSKGKFIIPLLLLSIVESSFEYFYETGQEDPSLTLHIRVTEDVLYFQLFFSKPANEPAGNIIQDKKTISLNQQLQNQYAGQYQLEVNTDNESISINLSLPLYSTDLINSKKIMINEAEESL